MALSGTKKSFLLSEVLQPPSRSLLVFCLSKRPQKRDSKSLSSFSGRLSLPFAAGRPINKIPTNLFPPRFRPNHDPGITARYGRGNERKGEIVMAFRHPLKDKSVPYCIPYNIKLVVHSCLLHFLFLSAFHIIYGGGKDIVNHRCADHKYPTPWSGPKTYPPVQDQKVVEFWSPTPPAPKKLF